MSDGNIIVLLKKSKENQEAAKLASENGFFHVSISRYYYSFFQDILYVVLRYEPQFSVFDTLRSEKNNEGPHVVTFNKFMDIILRELSLAGDNIFILYGFHNLKRCRKEADYTTKKFGKKLFEENFMREYKPVRDILDTILDKVGG